jgi:hypothetical protein
MSAMQEAFQKAGYLSTAGKKQSVAQESHTKLEALAKEAWKKWPNAFDPKNLWMRQRHIRNELIGDMTWCVVMRYDPDVIEDAIDQLLGDMNPNAGKKSAGGGQKLIDTHVGSAPAKPSPVPAQAGGGGHGQIDTHEPHAPAKNGASPPVVRRSEPARYGSTSTHTLPAAPPLSPQGARIQKAAEERLRALSKLYTVRVLVRGEQKPLAECTVGEVRAWANWAKTQRMHAHFAERLISNCNSNEKVGEIWKGKEKEVEKLYAEAEAEYAA